MKDLETRKDICQLVDTFYAKVTTDPKIGYFFTKVAAIDLVQHLPIMYNFWESTILGNHVYKGNPMLTHLSLNKKSPLKQEHFDRWLFLWKETIGELYEGVNATKAISLAEQIGGLMLFKIEKQR
ncbi:group III truncated hemoglobin [Flavobacteriaceae bacterium F08102]|nr:group III truncated hemoglobin [Flavobacteriaceae bacterium F08102]